MSLQKLSASRTDSLIYLLIDGGSGELQLDHVNHGVRITSKNAAPGGSVHGPFAALRTFRMVMAIDCSGLKLRADLVKLIAEPGHLVSAVLVAGDDLVDRVHDDSLVTFIFCPPDQLRGQLVHRDAASSEVPDIDVGNASPAYP